MGSKNLKIFWCSLAISTYALPLCAEDALKELERSPAFGEFQYQSSKIKRKAHSSGHYMDSESEYSSLFVNQRGVMQLVEWTAPYVQGYTKYALDAEKNPDFVRAFAKYAARDSAEQFAVEILVPHPRAIRAANLDLVEQFKLGRAAPADVTKQDTFKVRGVDSKLYSTKNNTFKLVVPLKKGALLYINTENCKRDQDLLDFERVLDIARLNRKLDS